MAIVETEPTMFGGREEEGKGKGWRQKWEAMNLMWEHFQLWSLSLFWGDQSHPGPGLNVNKKTFAPDMGGGRYTWPAECISKVDSWYLSAEAPM